MKITHVALLDEDGAIIAKVTLNAPVIIANGDHITGVQYAVEIQAEQKPNTPPKTIDLQAEWRR